MDSVQELVAYRHNAKSSSTPVARADVLVGALLVLVMVVGGVFRFTGLNWDDFTHLHPDERFLTDVASSLNGSYRSRDPVIEKCYARYPDTEGRGGYFDAECSLLNPHNVGKDLYVYGTLPLFMARGAGDLVNQLTGQTVWSTYSGVHLVWRTLSALAEMGAILLVFFIGIRLHDKWIGLLAAALYAAAVFSIQQAHFGTTDAMANFFSLLAIFFAVRVQTAGKIVDYFAFGLAFAAALASRINVAPLAGLIVLAAGAQLLPAFDPGLSWRERERLFLQSFGGLMIAGFVTLVAFRIFNPYTFMGPGFFGLSINPRWRQDLEQARHLVSGAAEMPPNWQWVSRPGYIFPFSNMVLWGMGIALGLTGWFGWLWSGWRLIRGRDFRNLILFIWVLGYFGWLGNNWVMSMRYYLPMYPMLAIFAAWALAQIVRNSQNFPVRRMFAVLLTVFVVGFTYLWALMFTNIYRHQLTRVQASHWVWEQIPGDFAMRIEGAGDNAKLINIAVGNGFGGDNALLSQASNYYQGQTTTVPFTASASGTVTRVYAPHLGDPQDDLDAERLRVSIIDEFNGQEIASGELIANLTRDNHPLGDSYEILLNTPAALTEGNRYIFVVEAYEGAPFISGGSVVSHEGAWDDAIPYVVCTLPPDVTTADDPPPGLLDANECNGRNAWSSLIVGYEMQLSYEDEGYKRDLMIQALDDSDYLTISSNRFYDGVNRIPIRWPMTNVYYEALFSGQLGYELVRTFEETFELGPLRVSDQYLPTFSSPKWLNEFEAEEAFHVYDHPAVFVFRKTDSYNPENTRQILNSVPMNRVSVAGVGYIPNCPLVFLQPGGFGCDTALIDTSPMSSQQGDAASTQLMLPEDRRAIQYSNGTWSERFDTDSPINTQPVFTVLTWWVTLIVIGWVVWPLLFTLLPGLTDRGYGLAKIAGLLLLGWLAWCAASLEIAAWNQTGILITLLLLALLSAVMVARRRAEFFAYIRQNFRRLLVIEAITLVVFIGFLFVRLTNPDLWHPSFGGEKPMDFAYFNGVLRSTVFPSIDPWYAGGYLNYYYFGYVIAGSPVLLLGIVPSVAYNLVLPTVFTLIGISAFSVAFNLAASWRVNSDDGEASYRLGSAWVAGITALLLAVVLGNLDTPRVFGTGLAQLGGYQQPMGLRNYLVDQYAVENGGVSPDEAAMMDILQRSNNNNFNDRLNYELNNSVTLVSSLLSGLSKLIGGEALPIGANRWYWGPTRVLAETPGVEGNAITEFPIFTFLYGDLHAHALSMPLMVLAMGFILNELLLARRDPRGGWAKWLALALGALTIGMLRATNTWDWPTFMVLGVAGLGFAWWLSWQRVTRRSLIDAIVRIGGFVALSFAFAMPYTTWYAATYGNVLQWQGGKTPLWAYFDLHGVFLFLIFCLLLWDTARWLRSVYVRSLRGTATLLTGLLGAVAAIGVALVILAAMEYQVVLIAVPLILWIAVLFFRPGQAREMQFVLVLAGLALALTIVVEFFVLDGDIGRQNTVFKFYIQVWLLFAVAGGAAFAWLLRASDNWSNGLRNVWYGVAALLFFVAALYPIMASRGRAVDRMAPNTPFTLDGMEYMKYANQYENDASIPLIDDYNMIRWLQENVEGTPVIIEAQSWREYLWSGRVAIYTGMPGVLGWRFHQTQQRTFDPLPTLVNQRKANISAFYSTTSVEDVWRIIEFYDIEYIIVAGLERAYYPIEGLAKFERMVNDGLLEKVYQAGEAAVYRVNLDATPLSLAQNSTLSHGS